MTVDPNSVSPRGPDTHPGPMSLEGPGSLDGAVGVGLRHPHIYDFIETPQPVRWLEIHSENYLAAGGPRMRALDAIRDAYPISCHGVGLSLGSTAQPDSKHLEALVKLFDWVKPALISEHLSWSVEGGIYLNDLLPLPLNRETFNIVARNIDMAQQRFQRRLLIENPSTYLNLRDDSIPEAAFLAELTEKTGCGLLLDVNNIYVSAHNRGLDAEHYLASIPGAAVGEIHIAGHTRQQDGPYDLLIDDHGSRVSPPVWQLLDAALHRFGPKPVLVEWDTEIPALPILLEEAAEAERRIAAITQNTDPQSSATGYRHAG